MLPWLLLTAGWGQTGYNERPSDQLRKLKLRVTSVDKLFVHTAVTNGKGEITDTCKGDSGGPLLIWRRDRWEVVGTLWVSFLCVEFVSLFPISNHNCCQGGGFNCRNNKTSGDGDWNNVASQLSWIRDQMKPDGGKGDPHKSIANYVSRILALHISVIVRAQR